MYIVREIFHLQFGRYKEAKGLMDEAFNSGMMPRKDGQRMLSDFTGKSYRLIFESSHQTLADFEKSLTEDMGKGDWQGWYEKFKPLVRTSEREILKVVS